MMGYHADEVIGSSNRKFFVEPEEANKIMDLVLREGKIKNYRAIMLRKDGEPVYISMSAALLRDKIYLKAWRTVCISYQRTIK
jgi:PAS domain S-box-containing protein